jgi:hypothetical protein
MSGSTTFNLRGLIDQLETEHHEYLLALCEKHGLDMVACRGMAYGELREMWFAYQETHGDVA